MSFETILKMIESVDPADMAKLNEIDARVWCYLKGKTLFGKPAIISFSYRDDFAENGNVIVWMDRERPFYYTRSRDALKAIRPEGWEWYMSQDSSQKGTIFGCASDNIGTNQMQSPMLPTEELAELHVIVQTIEYERRKNDR